MRKEGFFHAYRNQELFYQLWKSQEQVENVIIVTHGMGEHSESYIHFCEGMLPGNYVIYAWDLRGHGKSEGKRGVASVNEYVEDLDQFIRFVKSREGDKKYFLLGHSMGGLIQMSYLINKNSNDFAGAIFSSPLMGLSMPVPVVKDMAAKMLVKLIPNITLNNEIDNELLSHDVSIVRSYDRDPLRHDQVCPRLYLDFLKCFKEFQQKAEKLQLPILMQLAGDDRIVSLKSSEEVFSLLGSEDKQKIVYAEMYHEIYNEVGRKKVFEDLKAWIGERVD